MTDWDVTLGGSQFMLLPKTYRAMRDGVEAGDARPGRQRIADFSAGAHLSRPVRSGGEESGLGVSDGLWPAPAPHFPHLVQPAPKRQSVSGAIGSANPKLVVGSRDYLYLIAGVSLYRWTRDIASALSLRQTLGAAATCLTRNNRFLYIGYDAARDLDKHDDDTNTITASALGAGVQASMLSAWNRCVVLVAPGFPSHLHVYYGNSLAYWRTFKMDGAILGLCQYGDDLIVATENGLYRLNGEWYQDSDPPPPNETIRLYAWGTLAGQLQDSDDFAFMTVFNGRLLAWVGKTVVWLDTRDGVAWWRSAGLEGAATHGAAVVNGYLVVSIEPPGGSDVQLWAFNGSGWWLLDAAPTSTIRDIAGSGGGHLLAWGADGTTTHAYDLGDLLTATTLASPVELVSTALDAGEPDRGKHWREIGVQLARPDGQTLGTWTAQLAYSTDGGITWTDAGPLATVNAAQQAVSASFAVDAALLWLRLTLTQSAGLPPFIGAVWAEYTLLDTSVRRRKWQFAVRASDSTLNRAGASDGRDGQQIRSALWDLHDGAATLAFRPPEYAAEGIEYQVRMTALREEWDKPADHSTLGAHSTLHVTLVEV